MDSKEVKQALRDAREAIREKEYKTALKHCKSALKVDKNCYTAWVFVGVAAQEIDQVEQAVAAFRKAIEISPEQILAWQGLCALYDKHPAIGDFKTDRYEVYLKLAELSSNDPNKQAEFVGKLCDYYRNVADVDGYATILERCSTFLGKSREMLRLWRSFLNFCKENPDSLSESLENVVLRAYKETVFAESQEPLDREDLCREYFGFLLKSNKRDLMKEEAVKFGKSFPTSTVPLEATCRAYVDENLVLETPSTADVHLPAMSALLEKQPDSDIALLCKGLHMFASGSYASAIEALGKVTEVSPKQRESWLLLARCALKLHRYSKAEEWASKGLHSSEKGSQSAKDPITEQLLLCLADALRGQFNYSGAHKVAQKLREEVGETASMLYCCCKVFLDSGDVEGASEALGKLKLVAGSSSKLLELEAAILLRQKKFADAEDVLQKAVAGAASASALHLLALAQWEQNSPEEAVKNLFKAVQMDPDDYRNYVLLGKNYYRNIKDTQKALKCFQKAFKLNMLSEEAGTQLSDVLRDMGEDDQNAMFLKTITGQLPIQRAKWAWLRLGLIQMRLDSLDDAVQSLQNALRADPNDKHCWECLGEAYLRRNSLVAALLSFKKCLEFDPKDFFSLYQIANIKKEQEEFREATVEYTNALEVRPDYVPALKGLAETHLLLARQYLTQSLYGLALDSCEAALAVLGRAVPFAQDLVCLWKLLTDACLLPATMGMADYRLRIPASLLDGEVSEERPDRGMLLSLAERFSIKALTLKPKVAGLWHDLGLSYYLQGESGKAGAHQRALVSIQKAVSLNPKDPEHWNLLGVVAQARGIENFALAQHCFIKSIQLQTSNPVAWTNLGTLYLLNSDVKLAHSSFNVAQSQDPSRVNAWAGQALVAERVGHHDAMDLFRHSTLLGNHPEAACGYGRWICSTIRASSAEGKKLFRSDIQRACAIANASDALVRSTGNKEVVPSSLNMLGLLLERQGLLGGAENAYKRALCQLLACGDPEHAAVIGLNLSRVLCKRGKHQEALELLSNAEKSKDVLCMLGLIYDKLCRPEDALAAYEQALTLASDVERADVILCIALVTRRLHGDLGAKEVLTKRLSAGLSPEALVAATCIALLTSDGELAQDALAGLCASTSGGSLEKKASFLAACKLLLQGDTKGARNSLCRAVLREPTSSSLWCQLAQLLLGLGGKSAALAGHCARAALALGDCLDRVLSLLVLGALVQYRVREALSWAQKLVFMYPDRLSCWILLGTTLCSLPSDPRRDKVLQHDRFLLRRDVAAHWKHWSSLIQIHYAANQRQWGRAKELVEVALWGYSGSTESTRDLEVVGAACAALASSRKADAPQRVQETADGKGAGAFGWLVVSKLQQRAGDYRGAVDSIDRALKLNVTEGRDVVLNLRRAHLSLQIAKNDAKQKEPNLAATLECLGTALKMNPRCQAGHLLLAVWASESRNARLEKKSLERVLKLNQRDNSWPQRLARRLLVPAYIASKETAKLEELLREAREDDLAEYGDLCRQHCSELEALGIRVSEQ